MNRWGCVFVFGGGAPPLIPAQAGTWFGESESLWDEIPACAGTSELGECFAPLPVKLPSHVRIRLP